MVSEVFAPLIDAEMTISDALKEVFRISNANKTTSKGFNQATKAILGQKAIFVVMAKDYETQRAQIIQKLCEKSRIPIIEINSREELGSIVGFAKSKKEGNEEFTACGVAAFNNFVYETECQYFVEKYLRDVQV